MHDPILCKTCGACIGHKFPFLFDILHAVPSDCYIKTSDTRLEKALDDLDKIPHWDLFYLSGLIIDEKLNLVTDNLIKARTVLTTHAYAINSSAYDKILKYNPLIDSAIDGWYGQQSIDNIEIGTLFTKYVAYPLAIHQRFSLSDCDINEEGKSSMGHGLGVYFDCYSKPKIKLF
jgi:hypothetical protein